MLKKLITCVFLLFICSLSYGVEGNYNLGRIEYLDNKIKELLSLDLSENLNSLIRLFDEKFSIYSIALDQMLESPDVTFQQIYPIYYEFSKAIETAINQVIKKRINLIQRTNTQGFSDEEKNLKNFLLSKKTEYEAYESQYKIRVLSKIENVGGLKNSPLIEVMCYFLDIFTGPISKVIACICVIFYGAALLSGDSRRFNLTSFLSFILALALIYGSIGLANIISQNNFTCNTIRMLE